MKLNIFIISTGSEITSGKSVDTNSIWIANELGGLGYSVQKISILPDDPDQIKKEILYLAENEGSNLLIMTGGMGATADDHTLNVICDITGKEAVTHPKAYEKLMYISEARGRAYQEIFPVSMRQTSVPATSIVLENDVGLAPGYFLSLNENSMIVAMPGVPREMKMMFTNEFLPIMKKTYQVKELFSAYRCIWGVGEGIFQEHFIKPNNSFIKDNKIEWGVTARPGNIKVSFKTEKKDHLKKLMSLLDEKYELYIGNDIYNDIHDLLISSRSTLSTAESCTGGLLAKLFTDKPGSSAYFYGSVIAYHNEIKETILGVSKNTIIKYGSVSEETSIEMANGVQDRFNTHYSISITGIAGPAGETQEKKVGLVYICIKSHRKKPEVFKYQLNFGRETFRDYVAHTALFHLYQTLKKDKKGY